MEKAWVLIQYIKVIMSETGKKSIHNMKKMESQKTLDSIGLQVESKYPYLNKLWTDDITVDLPIKMGNQGVSAVIPTTIRDEWMMCLTKYAQQPALSVKQKNVWKTINFQQYYDKCLRFAKALIYLNIKEFKAVNIIGFNSPQWCMAFYGTIFARCIPVGVYTTNHKRICEYIFKHSEARLIVAENIQIAKKYLDLLDNGEIQRIIVYNDDTEVNNYGEKIMSWKNFLNLGNEIEDAAVEQRSRKVTPEQCCTLVYTSGTTGMPKGAMLSHDNLTYSPKAQLFRPGFPNLEKKRGISYLPLSHAASLYFDVVAPMINGTHIYFAESTALKGTIFETLKEVRPHFFFAVPRIWEKIYARLKQEEKNDKDLTQQILQWARSHGFQGTIAERRGWQTSQEFKKAKALVFDKLKAAIGVDQAQYLAFGAAPLSPQIRKYFLSMNIFLLNSYGMTETTGPHVGTPALSFNPKEPEDFLEVGFPVPGGDLKIKRIQNKDDEEGEICMRGRNIMMGYLKQPDETCKTIDSEGFLASGDLGRVSQDGYLFITGRAKELIITAGGENIPPVLIENEIKKALPCVANVMVVGEQKPYLNCLISLLEDPPHSSYIQKTAASFLASKGCPVNTIYEARSHPEFPRVIMAGLKEANEKAISHAQKVQNFYLMPEDFSIDNGTLTPSLKLKRKQALKKYAAQVDYLYSTTTKDITQAYWK